MKAGYYLGLILAVVILPVDLYAATPMETIKTEVDKILEILQNPDFKNQPKDFQIKVSVLDAIRAMGDADCVQCIWENIKSNNLEMLEYCESASEIAVVKSRWWTAKAGKFSRCCFLSTCWNDTINGGGSGTETKNVSVSGMRKCL